jgi:threonine/homoserine/homoserine lactone efflux protein
VHLLPFLAVSAVVIVTPGVDMALVTRNALLHGRTPALATAAGIDAGIAVWTLAAALGLAAVIAASAPAFAVVKLAGAVYLIYLGARTLVASRRGHARPEEARRTAALGRGTAFRQGLASNLLNPKIAVFFTSLLPQFVDGRTAAAADLLVLGAVFNVLTAAWLAAYAVVASRGRDVLGRPRVKRALDRVTGVVLVGLGARLALEHRR